MKKELDWQRLAAKLFCIMVFTALALLLPVLTIKILFPFILSALFCSLIIPVARMLSKFNRLNERACRVILLVASFTALSALILGTARSLCAQISELLQKIYNKEVTFEIPRLFKSDMGEPIVSLLTSLLAALGDAVGKLAAAAVSTAPSAMLFGIAFVMSSFYFCFDLEKIQDLISNEANKYLASVKKVISRIVVGYFRAYLILFALTFVTSFAGLMILGRKYALTAAFCIALVDMLPVLGTGAVLVPWSLSLLLTGKFGAGVGMAVLWMIISIIRGAAEPHIIGDRIGISPLISLVAAYAGFKLFGVVGMILFPMTVAVVKEICPVRIERLDK